MGVDFHDGHGKDNDHGGVDATPESGNGDQGGGEEKALPVAPKVGHVPQDMKRA
jgi:hypothetical protein